MLSVNNNMTIEQLSEYNKEELIELIGHYQKYVSNNERNVKPLTKVESTLAYTSPKIDIVAQQSNYSYSRKYIPGYEIDNHKTFFTQKSINNDEYKVPNEFEQETIRFKQIVNVLLNSAVNEQRTDLIEEVQNLLNRSHQAFV